MKREVCRYLKVWGRFERAYWIIYLVEELTTITLYVTLILLRIGHTMKLISPYQMETQHHGESGTVPLTVVLVLAALPLIVVIYLVTNSPQLLPLFTSASSKYPATNLPLVKTEERQSALVSGFPEFPVYDGAIIQRSFAGTENGLPVYEAVWAIDLVDGKPIDVTSVRKIMHWFEDDALPTDWIFEEPLQQEGDSDNPSKSWLTVSRNGVYITVTVELQSLLDPIIVRVDAKKF
jgi:hypothetical protein